MENLNKLRDIDALKISLASAEEIQSWSYGEVLKPETINYRTFKPEKDGLFCERIFGPVKDYECYCGKYKRIRYKGVVCDRCGVQVTTSKVRRERMGHINLISPVAHVWMFKNIPSIMATLLGIAPRSLELVVYFSSFIVTDIDHDAKKALMKTFDERAKEAREKAQVTFEEQIDAMYQEAEEKVKSLSTEAEKKWKEEKLIHKAKEIREKANLKVDELQKTKHMELERAELEVRKIQKKLQEVEMHIVMSDREYLDLEEYLDEFCEVSIGAEAVQKILEKFDVQALAEELREELKKAGASKIDRVRKRLKIAESFIRGNVDPRNMIITALPVIPPDLRPMVMLEGGRFATSDLNDLYRRIINRNNRLKRLVELGAPDIIVRNEKRMLQEAVDALFDSSKVRKSRTRDRKTYRSIADAIKGKQGHFRANLLGKRVDYSGRAVIVAGPNLKVNECGLPTDMALELFRPFLIREIMNRGLAPNMKTAKYVLEERGDAVYDILEELVKTRPVLLNRAPTLHRLSVQAFYPKLISEKAIQLHPVVCAGFNADFDGDQMAVHLPLSDEAVEEALELMLASKNLLKPADGSVTSIPSHEMVLGIYYLTSVNEHLTLSKTIFSDESEVLRAIGAKAIDLRQKIRMDLNGEIIETTAGRVVFNEMLPVDLRYMNIAVGKSKVKDIVKSTLEKYGAEVAIDLIDDLKLNGFKYSTLSGISLSIFDCGKPEDLDEVVAKGKEESAKIEQNYYMGLITRNELSKLSYKIWQKVLDHFDETILASIDSENPVKLVITAGAGKASAVQIRQISAIKGLITDPNGKVIDVPVFGNYANGMSSFDYFLTGRGTRKSYMDKGLGTADAGYLTRRLVNVAQDVLVREVDCGTKQGRTIKRGEDTPLATWANRLIGRAVMKDVKDGDTVLVKKGELVTAAQAKAIDAAASISEVVIRSALTCETPYGVCEKCYGTDLSVNEPGKIGLAAGIIAAQSIGEPGTQLSMQTFHAGGIARSDITQGLPRVEELFEARKPRAQAIMSPIAGIVSIEENEDFTIITIAPTDKKEELVVIKIESHEELTVSDKSSVSVGTQLTSGALNLQELFDMLGTTATQMYLLDEAQRVYGSQGVAINDKHVEIIIRQMCNRVRVKKAGTTGFLPGDIVTKYKLAEENKKAKELGGEQAEAEPILLGISRISRMSESWLDAASFEETSNVLTESAIAGSIDRLIGLKENVIIGRRIPVGDAARVPEAVDSSEI